MMRTRTPWERLERKLENRNLPISDHLNGPYTKSMWIAWDAYQMGRRDQRSYTKTKLKEKQERDILADLTARVRHDINYPPTD